ncbi:M23 family metallopeptidase [Sphingomonas sp. BIUV-7]|uniref:M23 family metallopeptidase n=1 Tax=Sphingomonas natans TaxID=3063330 RepID=A0ABT8Y6R7_9SPHN|nr:M23 family metallopeptidase [Sphingomonas sp. BIUV-7]MDO6414016.1 M23 family metallopeptidase [Sphingomonas sp. BIUV-7]
MYRQGSEGLTGGGAGAVALRSRGFMRFDASVVRRGIDRTRDLDLVVDLGARIGSGEWWRGLATCTALCASAFALAPSWHPIAGPTAPALGEAQQQEMRAQAIAPAAYGADSGRAAAPTKFVEALTDTPERPQIEIAATLGTGDGFARVLTRAGVGEDEAKRTADLVASAVSLGEIKPGTKLDMTLGRRPNRKVARPLDKLAFRAKFELALEVNRNAGQLQLLQKPIAVDETPLRIQGRVGSGLFSAARAAGAPPKAIETYLRALGQHLSVGSIRSNDRFDLIVEHRRAATGETETGGLLYGGLDSGKKVLRLLKWTDGGKEQWFDAAGVGNTKTGGMKMPVQGHLTSGFGARFHPILGYSRMHQGVDYGAPMGSPIIAATDGTVRFAGWHGGHGNYVQLAHSGNMQTGYAHMSRIIAKVGQSVRAGQLIGYVGSTGLSTGPHLHFEVFQNGRAMNPMAVKFSQAAQLAGAQLTRFKATLSRLLSVRVGG